MYYQKAQIKDGSISSSALKEDFDFIETGVQEYGEGILGKLRKIWNKFKTIWNRNY